MVVSRIACNGPSLGPHRRAVTTDVTFFKKNQHLRFLLYLTAVYDMRTSFKKVCSTESTWRAGSRAKSPQGSPQNGGKNSQVCLIHSRDQMIHSGHTLVMYLYCNAFRGSLLCLLRHLLCVTSLTNDALCHTLNAHVDFAPPGC